MLNNPWSKLAVLLVVALLVGCEPEEDQTCIVTVIDGSGNVVAADTVVGSSEVTTCRSTVSLDSVGSDTTPEGVRYTTFKIDSVGSDTTPGARE